MLTKALKNKLSYQLSFYIIIISLVITSFSLYNQINYIYKSELERFETELNNIEADRLEVLSEALWNVNHPAVYIFLDNLLNNEKFTYVKISETDGNIIEQGVYQETNSMVKEFNIYKIIKNENYAIGKILIVADLNPLYEKLKKQAIYITAMELIKIFFIVLMIILFIRKFLIHKLILMSNYAKELSLETLDKPLDIYPDKKSNREHNELDLVVNAMNTMRHNLLEELQRSKEKDNILTHQSKMAALGEMLGNISHQWRQPLSLISTASSGIKIKHEMNILEDGELIDLTDRILTSTEYLSDTIEDFRNYFKPDKEKNIFKLEKVIDKTLHLIDHQVKNNDITIVKNIPDIEITGYENELIQVLINIVNNAKDQLLKQQHDRLILITSSLDNQVVTMSIKDSGGGIDETIISKIFEPYFTTKDKSQGTGIGLYMCQEIITKHFEGNIRAQNSTFIHHEKTYFGAEFIITLKQILTL